jgi:hypothetical protein
MLPGRLYNHNASLTDAWKYGKVFAGSYYHPACSCRLGKVRPSLPPSLPPSFLPLLISSSRHCLIFPQLPPPSLPPYLNPFSFCFQTMQCLTANSFRPSLPPSLLQVVDEELRVFRVSGLRVADASILPRIGSAGPLGK